MVVGCGGGGGDDDDDDDELSFVVVDVADVSVANAAAVAELVDALIGFEV